MEQWTEIRRRVLVEQVSQRQILRETGMHWKTLQKILEHSEPPGYQRDVPFSKPKISPFLDRIRQILAEDRRVPRKQRHTAKRIFERIQQEGYTGGYTQVKEVKEATAGLALRYYKPKFRSTSPSERSTLLTISSTSSAVIHSGGEKFTMCPKVCRIRR